MYNQVAGRQLLNKLCTQVKQLEHNTIMDLITRPSPVLFDAIKSGNVEAVKMLIDKNREFVTIKDPQNGRNLLHLVVLFRQESIFESIPNTLKENLGDWFHQCLT